MYFVDGGVPAVLLLLGHVALLEHNGMLEEVGLELGVGHQLHELACFIPRVHEVFTLPLYATSGDIRRCEQGDELLGFYALCIIGDEHIIRTGGDADADLGARGRVVHLGAPSARGGRQWSEG